MSDHIIALGTITVVTVALRLASPLANATTVALCLLLVVLFVARSLGDVRARAMLGQMPTNNVDMSAVFAIYNSMMESLHPEPPGH